MRVDNGLLADISAVGRTEGWDDQEFDAGEVLRDATERRWTEGSGRVDRTSKEERQRRQPRKLPGPEQSRMTYECRQR